jgi:hypothetical protein
LEWKDASIIHGATPCNFPCSCRLAGILFDIGNCYVLHLGMLIEFHGGGTFYRQDSDVPDSE